MYVNICKYYVRIFVCVCMYVRMYVCMYVRMCVYLCVNYYVYLCMHLYVHVCIYWVTLCTVPHLETIHQRLR